MINCIKNTSSYKSLNLGKELFHAYLFYSSDKELNNNIALNFAKSFVCENGTSCNNCNGCKQFEANTHPDITIVDQKAIRVEDANAIIDKLNTKPIYSKYKIFIILNAENINEVAQNKLLKSIEEPTSSSIFIFTSSKTDKLLPTVLSRFNKLYVPILSNEDKISIAKELKEQNIDIFKHINSNLNLTEMLNFANNESYLKTIESIKSLFTNLKTTQDIPKVTNSLGEIDKHLFLTLLQDIFLNSLNNGNKFENSLTEIINNTFSKKALAKCLPLINEAYKMQLANVNFSYILDNLLFNILKEKFLCR